MASADKDDPAEGSREKLMRLRNLGWSWQVAKAESAERMKSAWNAGGEISETALCDAHILLSIDDISAILSGYMGTICRRVGRTFPLIDGNGDLVSPLPDDPELIANARDLLRGGLARGRYDASGVDAREPFRGRQRIPADTWGAVAVDFDRSEVSTGVVVIRDVRVSIAGPAPEAKSPPQSGFSEKQLERWFKARAKGWPPGSPPPSEAIDWKAAKSHFGCNIARGKFREIRRKHAPEWCKRGRPPRAKPAK
jgi:hypothetical protein